MRMNRFKYLWRVGNLQDGMNPRMNWMYMN